MKEETSRGSGIREIELYALFQAVWKRRLGIFLTVLAAFVLSLVYSLTLPKVYQSRGFFSRDMTIVEYKRLLGLLEQSKDLFNNGDQEDRSINTHGLSAEAIKISGIDFSKLIAPIYTVTREEAKVGMLGGKKEGMLELMGVRITATGESPQVARNWVLFLGEYIRDRLIYLYLYDYISQKYELSTKTMAALENELIDLNFTIGQLQKKHATILAFSKRYPQSYFTEGHQIINLKEDGYRYLSPAVQAMGIEAEIAEYGQKRDTVTWQKEKVLYFVEIFADLNRKLSDNTSGVHLFRVFSNAVDDLGRDSGKGTDALSLALNELKMDRQSIEAAFFQNSRFLSNPILPKAPIKPKKIVIMGIMTFLALICAVGLVMIREIIRMLGRADREHEIR